jgi:SAM-dependent methyltransferase
VSGRGLLAGVRSLGRRPRRPALADRYEEGRVATPLLERLSDEDVEVLNELLPWQCFTVDERGRPFGRPAREGKRTDPQAVPDPRILRFDERFGVAGRRVLEVGCFEGVHTTALCRRGADVVAVDGRIENVVKTIVRCAFFGESPTVLHCDLERVEEGDEDRLRADLCHHVGVLYHLTDPIGHLRMLGRTIGAGMMLDTHYALPDDALEEYAVDGQAYRFRRYEEGGRDDAFSGMEAYARWLLLDDIAAVLREGGFETVEVVEKRAERNGPRVLLFAEKSR